MSRSPHVWEIQKLQQMPDLVDASAKYDTGHTESNFCAGKSHLRNTPLWRSQKTWVLDP